MIVKLSDDIISLCDQFANLTYGSSLDEYARRGQENPEKIIQDIAQGKRAEFSVMYWLLHENHEQVSIPDLSLHRKKSFSPDLTTSKFNVHVKSQNEESFKRYGKSFLFQKKDPLIFNPKPNDVIIVVSCINKVEHIVNWLGHPAVVEWQEPRIEKLRSTKVAIYL